jgi:glutathione S-transferase
VILIGQFDSPFVRRVAVTLQVFGMPFEHRDWSVGRDFDRIRGFNPLGRVPTLVLASGESLVDSAAILDYLDEVAGVERALLPAAGTARRAALQLMALAIGAADKGVLQIYETVFRPEEKRHAPWTMRCRLQMLAALEELEKRTAARGDDWLVGARFTQADLTVACVLGFLRDALGVNRDGAEYPALARLSARCEALPAFLAVPVPVFGAPEPLA